ncbi:MAG: bifunctional DNA-formamidopyrimidine glycosylase/DNA-(apurinic or apyrimidinic site) lyase [Gammaproteobacteria bacterium]|nr:bifunctional DNA-formamidopyrimidine glycosylase/DNA-(apurinic or apyrimidinic site) lyase [Gammaproteobacteria bacterium]
MPELPEVETARRGIEPLLAGQTINRVHIRQAKLRWPVPRSLCTKLPGAQVVGVRRRAKYLLIDTSPGTVLVHLGMSGSLAVVPVDTPYRPHDRVALDLANGQSLRLHDPRRFGAVLWAGHHPDEHALLKDIGPEPLSEAFNADYLYRQSRKRKRALREFLLDGHIVAGIGNIYANEALFLAGIRPTRPAGRLTRAETEKLVATAKSVLKAAIRKGGTTLRDFHQADGQPGYFQQTLHVYGREGQACPNCGQAIQRLMRSNRSLFYCRRCQN